MAIKASDIPPVIERQRQSEQGRFFRKNPEAKVHMLLELQRTTHFGMLDCRALAYWSLRAEFGNEHHELPPGSYGNARGDWFTIDDWGLETPLRFSPGQVWEPIRMTTSHRGKIHLELRFSCGRWLAPAQLYGMDGTTFPLSALTRQDAPTAIQTQQPSAVPALRLTFPSPAVQQQFNHGSAPPFTRTAVRRQPHVNNLRFALPLVSDQQASRISAAERMGTAETTGNAESTPIRVTVQRRRVIRKPDESISADDPFSEIIAFNARTPWQSEEARLRHEELKTSMLPLPAVNEITDPLDEEELSDFRDLPTIVYVY